MPIFLTYFLSGAFLANLAFRFVAALGFSVVGFVGIDIALDALQVQLNNNLSGIPITAKQLLDMSGVTTIVFWLVQAYAFRALLSVGRSFLMRKQ